MNQRPIPIVLVWASFYRRAFIAAERIKKKLGGTMCTSKLVNFLSYMKNPYIPASFAISA